MPKWISLPDLKAATGASDRNIAEWRRRGLLPPCEWHAVPGRGSVSLFPPAAIPMTRRIMELGRESHDADKWRWSLWAEGFPIDVRDWLLGRIADLIADIEKFSAAQPTLAASPDDFLRRQGVANRVRRPDRRREFADWLIAWGTGASDHAAFAALFDTLGAAVGIDLRGMKVPRGKIVSEPPLYWLRRFERIIRLAGEKEFEQARRDWRALAILVEGARCVDWSMAPALPVPGAPPEPQSWAARKALRQRKKPPPGIVDISLRTYETINFRPVLFAIGLIARRLFTRSPMPQMPDQVLAIAGQWLAMQPRLPVPDPRP